MALLTLERSASLASFSDDSESDSNEADDSVSELSTSDSFSSSKGKFVRLRSPSFEGYFASRGGAISLSHQSPSRHVTDFNCEELQFHLQAIVSLLRDVDVLKMAVRLESCQPGKKRYLVLISSDDDESVILGFNWTIGPVIALVLPIYNATQVQLDGDGGLQLSHPNIRKYSFKPVSVQTLWSANHILQRSIELAQQRNYFYGGQCHSFLPFYHKKVVAEEALFSEWNEIPEVFVNIAELTTLASNDQDKVMYRLIRTKLKEVMMAVDLDMFTCKQIREKCEEELNMDLKEYKAYLDKEMMYVMGQMDSASKILDYIYLGSEWNASNLEELEANEIGYILNCTKEVDNFFPDRFVYYNVSVLDEEKTELLRYWDYTYRYITQALEANSKVLVHCRRGISRSASTVVAYIMKAYGWTLSKSLEYTKTRRSIVQPNSGFLKQLIIYEGMLNSSRNRYNALFVVPLSPPHSTATVKEKRKQLLDMRTSSPASDTSDGAFAEDNEAPLPADVPPINPPTADEGSTRDIALESDTSFVFPCDVEMTEQDRLQTQGDEDGERTPTALTPQLPRTRPTDLPLVHGDVATEEDFTDFHISPDKQRRTCRMQRRQTEAGLDSLTADDVKEDQRHIMQEAMLVLERRSDMLKSLELLQVRRGTKFRLERHFTVENTIKPSHLRRLSLGSRSATTAECDTLSDSEARLRKFRERVDPLPEGTMGANEICAVFLRRSRYNVREDNRRRTFDESQFRAGEHLRSYDVEKEAKEYPQGRPEDASVVVTSQFRTVKDSKEWLEQFAKEPFRKPRSPRRRTVGITSITRPQSLSMDDNSALSSPGFESVDVKTEVSGDSTMLSVDTNQRLSKSAERLSTLEDAISEGEDAEGVSPIETTSSNRNEAAKFGFRQRRTMSESLPKKVRPDFPRSVLVSKDALVAADHAALDTAGQIDEVTGGQSNESEAISRGFVQERIQNFMSSTSGGQHDKVKRVKSYPGVTLPPQEDDDACPATPSLLEADENCVLGEQDADSQDAVAKAQSAVFISVSPSEKAAQDVRFLVGRYENPPPPPPQGLISCPACPEEVSTG